MSPNHTFSIIFYKESSFIDNCIQSLLNQSLKSKIIICTSTPTIEIKKVAKKYNIPLLINPDPGKANDWNFALTSANSRYVTLTHHDDDYHSSYLKKVMDTFNKYEDALICFTDYYESFVAKNGEETTKRSTPNLLIKRLMINLIFLFRDNIKPVFQKKLLLRFGDTISCPTVTYDKKNLGMFKFNEKMPINLDWEAWWRMTDYQGSFSYVRSAELTHRIHLDSHTTHAISGNERLKEDIIMFNKIWHPLIAKLLIFFYKISYKGNNA